MLNSSKLKNPLKFLLIFALLLLLGNVVLSQKYLTDSLNYNQLQGDTVKVFKNAKSYTGVVVENMGEKIKIEYLEKSAKGKQEIFKQKFVFTPIKHNSTLIPKTLRFRYTEPTLATDVILKSAVLGFNKEYFLLEFTHNTSTQITMEHKSRIVQNDLKVPEPK